MRGNILAVIGAQYGSEGKGVIVSSIANEYDVHVRVGSPNAGHTFLWQGEKHIMQVIPCGWINENARIIIGRGALINVKRLLTEISHIEEYYPDFKKRLFIDKKAAILQEKYMQEEGGVEGRIHARIGSTGEGVGAARIGRIQRQSKEFLFWEDIAPSIGLECLSTDNTPMLIASLQDEGYNILLEGTQGSALSLIHGPWPYVTSIDTNAGQLLSEVGIAPSRLTQVLLVARTFPIRVAGNSGPMNNEISWEDLSERIGKKVSEKTTVTKKVRRVAEWDNELLENAILLNGPTSLALTFMDYVDPTCIGISNRENLPQKSKEFVQQIEDRFNTKISILGTGGPHLSTIRLLQKL